MGRDVGGGRFNDVQVRIRRDTQTQWYFKNSVLGPGEVGYEVDTNMAKIGDGVTPYNQRPYFGGGSGGGSGTVTSVNATVSSGALQVTGGPITTSGTFSFTWGGSVNQFVLGNGSLASIATILGPYVPYTGATATVDINTQSFSAGFVRSFGNFGSQVAVAMNVQNINAGGVSQHALLNDSGLIFGEIKQTNTSTNYGGALSYLLNNSTYLQTNGTELGIGNTSSGGNIKLFVNNSGTITYAANIDSNDILFNSNSSIQLRFANTARFSVVNQAIGTTSQDFLSLLPPNYTPSSLIEHRTLHLNARTRTWSGTGTINTNRENLIDTTTYASSAALIITNAFGISINAPTAGANVTLSNNWAIGTIGGILLTDHASGLYNSDVKIQSAFNARFIFNNTATGVTWYMHTNTVAATDSWGVGISQNNALNFLTIGNTGITTISPTVNSNIKIAEIGSGFPGIYFQTTTPGLTNYTFGGDGVSAVINAPATGGSVLLRSGGTTVAQMLLMSSTNVTGIYFPGQTSTLNAASNNTHFYVEGNTTTFTQGTTGIQRENRFTSSTYLGTGSGSVITDAYGVLIEAPTAGILMTITNNWSLGLSGNLSVLGKISQGSSAPGAATFRMSQTHTGGTTQTGIFLQGTIDNTATAAWRGIIIQPSFQNATYTTTDYIGMLSGTPGVNAGNTITNLRYFDTGTEISAATIVYGYYGRIGVGTNRWNLYMNGTAQNYLAGNLGIGITVPTSKLHVVDTNLNQLMVSYNASNYFRLDVSSGGTSTLSANGGNNSFVSLSDASGSYLNYGAGSGIGNYYIGNGVASLVTGNTAVYYVEGGNLGLVTAQGYNNIKSKFIVEGNSYLGANLVASAFLHLAAGTTSFPQIQLTQGVAPTSPSNGQLWRDANNIQYRDAGVTKSILAGRVIAGSFLTPDLSNAVEVVINGTTYTLQIVT